MTLRTVLLSLQALLSAAEPDDPQDAVVAKQYKEHPEMFRQTATHWTFVYAGGKYYYTYKHLCLYEPSFMFVCTILDCNLYEFQVPQKCLI